MGLRSMDGHKPAVAASRDVCEGLLRGPRCTETGRRGSGTCFDGDSGLECGQDRGRSRESVSETRRA